MQIYDEVSQTSLDVDIVDIVDIVEGERFERYLKRCWNCCKSRGRERRA